MMCLPWRAALDELMTPRLCLVVAFINSTADAQGLWTGNAFHIEDMARTLGFSRAFVTKALPRLVELGYLQVSVAPHSYWVPLDVELPRERVRSGAGGDVE